MTPQGCVGKGRPPKAHRFKPGTSGNPKGRPTGHRNFLKLFGSILDKGVQINWNSGVDTVSLAEAVCMMSAKAAMSGDSRAMESFLRRIQRGFKARTSDKKGRKRLAAFLPGQSGRAPPQMEARRRPISFVPGPWTRLEGRARRPLASQASTSKSALSPARHRINSSCHLGRPTPGTDNGVAGRR